MIDGVIFDMDGTLFDSEPVWAELWTPALAPYGLVPSEDFVLMARGTATESTCAVIRQFYGDDVPAEEITSRLFEIGAIHFAEHGAPKMAGVDEILAWLAERGVPMAVASSNYKDIIEGNLRHGGIERHFSHVVCAAEVENPKPAPDIFLEAARRIGTDPARTLVVEDSYNGIASAHAGGFIVAYVPCCELPTEPPEDSYQLRASSLLEVLDALRDGRLG